MKLLLVGFGNLFHFNILKLVFSSFQMHTVLDEIIFGGQVLETSSTEVLKAVEEISKFSL